MLEARRLSAAALLLLPAGLMVYLAFNSGGYFPGARAFVAIVLCVIVAIRAIGAAEPTAAIGPQLGIAAGAMAAFAALTWISAKWSHEPGVARLAFDLPLLYLLALILFGSLGRTEERLAWSLRAIAVGCVVICGSGLITRVLPHVWPTSSTLADNQLSFPVTYWNVLALIAVVGIVLCVHFSSDLREPPAERVLAAACVPILACTVYFTFSRGALVICAVAVVAYLVLGRPRGLLASLLAIVPPTAIAVIVAYDANLLATRDPTTPKAVSQGHHVAIAIGACVVAAAALRTLVAWQFEQRLERIAPPPQWRRPRVLAGGIALVVAAAVVALALNGTIAREYHRFTSPAAAGSSRDFRTRLTDPANGVRVAIWKVAWAQFKRKPVLGAGAGTFPETWARYRTGVWNAQGAHSLYLQALDELGVVGFALLVTAILTILVVTVGRIRASPRPALYAAGFAVLIAWAIQAAVDWDWEMPVITVVFFALGGFMLAREPGRAAGSSSRLKLLVRPLVAAAALAMAVVPAVVWLSQRKLDQASYAFSQGDCRTARSDALASISTLGNRAESYELVGYCDLRLGMTGAAVAALGKAVSLDPYNWNYRYGLALMRGAAGLDPRLATLEAVILNPLEPLAQQAWKTFVTSPRSRWPAEARGIANGFTSL